MVGGGGGAGKGGEGGRGKEELELGGAGRSMGSIIPPGKSVTGGDKHERDFRP